MNKRTASTVRTALAVAVLLTFAHFAGCSRERETSAERKTIQVSNAVQLQEILAHPRRNLTVVLAPGEYRLTQSTAYDSSCGNCEDPDRVVSITVGMQISGERVVLSGSDSGEAIIYTQAGYGIFFKDCQECSIRGVTITGGERDTSQEATDAAIVVKRSSVVITRNKIVDNIGDPAVVIKNIVGIMGVCGRENSHLRVYDNRIVRNSWDGIALYRDAEATIENNLIDGVDKAGGREAGGGRGVGIGVTWNAKATIERNLVKRYWKGVGIFVDGSAEVRHNVVEEMLTWGIAYWDAGKGKPRAVIENNVVYDCGACGVSVTREAPFEPGEVPSRLVGNLVVGTGRNPKYDDPNYYCFQCALALHAVPDGFVIAENIFFDNRRGSDDLPDRDLSSEDFLGKKQEFFDEFFSRSRGYDSSRDATQSRANVDGVKRGQRASPSDWIRRHSSFLETYMKKN